MRSLLKTLQHFRNSSFACQRATIVCWSHKHRWLLARPWLFLSHALKAEQLTNLQDYRVLESQASLAISKALAVSEPCFEGRTTHKSAGNCQDFLHAERHFCRLCRLCNGTLFMLLNLNVCSNYRMVRAANFSEMQNSLMLPVSQKTPLHMSLQVWLVYPKK